MSLANMATRHVYKEHEGWRPRCRDGPQSTLTVRVRETTDKTTTETAHYLLSRPLAPERFNEVVRQHWGVENSLHWRLDVVMNEDQDRTRMGHGP